MTTSVVRKHVKQIKQVVAKHYNFWRVFNDKRLYGRRLKFMKNGYKYTDEEYKQIVDNIVKELKAHNIPHIKVYKAVSVRSFYGPYTFLAVTLIDD